MKQLYCILRGKTDSSYLLSEINIYVPPCQSRSTDIFLPTKSRTNVYLNSPLQSMMTLYNKLAKLDPNIDIFYDSKRKFEDRILQALVQHHQMIGK